VPETQRSRPADSGEKRYSPNCQSMIDSVKQTSARRGEEDFEGIGEDESRAAKERRRRKTKNFSARQLGRGRAKKAKTRPARKKGIVESFLTKSVTRLARGLQPHPPGEAGGHEGRNPPTPRDGEDNRTEKNAVIPEKEGEGGAIGRKMKKQPAVIASNERPRTKCKGGGVQQLKERRNFAGGPAGV